MIVNDFARGVKKNQEIIRQAVLNDRLIVRVGRKGSTNVLLVKLRANREKKLHKQKAKEKCNFSGN